MRDGGKKEQRRAETDAVAKLDSPDCDDVLSVSYSPNDRRFIITFSTTSLIEGDL